MNEEYYIGQIFEVSYPTDAANWCNVNDLDLVEIEPIDKEIEEEYEDVETVIIPETDTEPEHTEERNVIKTRMVEKTIRRYQIQERPENTVVAEKKKDVRAIRDSYIRDIEWRVSRYRDQAEMQIETTDTEETYIKILQYMQYLRDYPESSETWYEQNPMTWDEWQQNN